MKQNRHLWIFPFDHHGNQEDINTSWRCLEEIGADIALIIRDSKEREIPITLVQASLYEDMDDLTFLSMRYQTLL